MLHVLGCVGTGGEVTGLEISPLYGGALFARFFPWITTNTEYAGRLSGFRAAGDLSYLVTVLAPLVVLCLLGSALARFAVRRRRPWLLGLALGAALQPLASLTGDCYEAASIPITRLANFAGLDWALRLRGDDLTKVAQQAALVHSPLAWGLVAAGCLGGFFVAALTLILSGGIAPRGARLKSQQAPEGSSRRSLLQAGLALALLATGGWILKRVYLPRHLRPAEVETLAALLDTLIPEGEFCGARRTGFLDRLLRECDSKRQTRRALVEGVQCLDSKAKTRGASGFLGLASQQREDVVEECARAADGTLPRFFYRTVRDRAMQLHYSQLVTWKPLRFDHPPQPEGYLDHWQKPDA